MKEFLLFVFLLTYSFNSSAHMAHYNKFNKIEMEILRDGEVIGYNYYFFKKDKDNTIVTNQLKFTVKLFGATIFEVESYGEEKYNKDKLRGICEFCNNDIGTEIHHLQYQHTSNKRDYINDFHNKTINFLG